MGFIDVIGFKPKDETWTLMKNVYDSCNKLKIKVPDVVMAYFEHRLPDPRGVPVDKIDLVACGALRPYPKEDSQSDYQLFVDLLPKDVKIVQFMLVNQFIKE